MENICVSVIFDAKGKELDLQEQSLENVEVIAISDSVKNKKEAVDLAKGEYILFTNSGEHLFYNCLKELYEQAQKYGCDLVQCGNYVFDGKNVQPRNNWRKTGNYTCEQAVNEFVSLDSFYSKEEFDARTIFKSGLCGALIKKEVLTALSDELLCEDENILFYNILKNSSRVRYFSNPLLYVDAAQDYDFDKAVGLYNKYKNDEPVADWLLASALICAKKNGSKEAETFLEENSSFYDKHKEYIDVILSPGKSIFRKALNAVFYMFEIRNKSKDDKKATEHYYKTNKNKKIFIVSAPTHDNLGDQAILSAEELFIKENLPDYETVVLTESDYYLHKPFMHKYMGPDDVIAFHGGGNMGDGYRYIENYRRSVIKEFKDKRFFIFPQTAFFSDSETGKKALEKSVAAYAKNKNLLIFAREPYSYDVMSGNFKNDVKICPDIVMYMNLSGEIGQRDGVLLCLRNDFESNIGFADVAKLRNSLEKRFGHVNVTDMCSHTEIDDGNRETEINEKLTLFKQYGCVITDRLHGMIFAAVSGTPCVVLGNYNHKVKSSCGWFKDLGYIKFVEDIADVPDAVGEVMGKETSYDNSFAKEYYEEIVRYVKNGN